MKSYFNRLLFICFKLLLCTVAVSAHANSPTPNKPQNKLSTIADICLISPHDCLARIDETLLSIPQNSRVFFELLQYKYDALFNLQKTNELYTETKKWLHKPNLPVTFEITNAIYFAKSSHHIDDKDEAKKSYLVAKSLLEEANNAFPSPLRLVQFANLQMHVKKYEEAYLLLTSLAEKYKNSPDTRFMMEVHGNLGHCASNLGDFEQSLIHWQDALFWGEKFDNKQQLAVILFNLAEVHFILEQYELSKKFNVQSIENAIKAKDEVKKNHALIHLAEAQSKLKEFDQAKATLISVNETALSPNKKQLFEQLKETIIKE